MHISIDNIITQVQAQFDSPLPGSMLSVLQTSLANEQGALESLGTAFASGNISREEFETGLEREKNVVTTEMETWQINADSEVRQVVNLTFDILNKTLI
ncbi:hypothetical protein VQ7734_02549 [Vibrio quintilis]|uniref:Uncharacterized protein n=2 Tax=Vibrio quintilis TaxID=1117707 RepID=A0A1M7YVR8_9VIBR|nr:hypothetical protein VQ7734_02549 [Vibrio quintilis]